MFIFFNYVGILVHDQKRIFDTVYGFDKFEFELVRCQVILLLNSKDTVNCQMSRNSKI